jgi:hypothetical protein
MSIISPLDRGSNLPMSHSPHHSIFLWYHTPLTDRALALCDFTRSANSRGFTEEETHYSDGVPRVHSVSRGMSPCLPAI